MHANATLAQRAWACIAECDPDAKLERTAAAADDWRAGRLIPPGAFPPSAPIGVSGRPPRPRLVPAREVPRRGFHTREGRAALLHALAHIEFNAINLAWDAVYRFRGLPDDYYTDWVRIAAEESTHFRLLRDRLREMGFEYGAFDAHDGLWEMARETAHDVLLRMALVPRVLEARGLDVTPAMLQRLQRAGDPASAAILEIIQRDEIGHVASGTRWFRHVCAVRGLEPEREFAALLRRHLAASGGRIKGPLNIPARTAAGFSAAELELLSTLGRASCIGWWSRCRSFHPVADAAAPVPASS